MDTKDWFAVFSAIMMGTLMLTFVVMVQPLNPLASLPSPTSFTHNS